MGTRSVSVVIKAKNEEHQIVDCIKSVQGFATEVIVVNDRSTDGTAELAKSVGARVIDAESRNGLIDVLDKIGFETAKGDWILRMDADERMTPGLAVALLAAASSSKYAGVRFARKQILFGKWVKYGGWFNSDQLRFFRRDAWGRNWSAFPHTQVPVKGDVLTLPSREDLATIHYDYDTIEQFVRRTFLGYAKTEAILSYESGQQFSPFKLVFKPIKRFLGRLIIRQGFRDGWHGLILAGLLAAYDLCIEANLWDIQRQKGR